MAAWRREVMMSSYILGLVGALTVLLFTIEMLRRGILREKYAALWLVVGLFLLVLSLFPALLTTVSRFLGVQVPVNLLFFLAALTLLVVSVQLSYEISRSENRIGRLAEELALLRHEVEETRSLVERIGLKVDGDDTEQST